MSKVDECGQSDEYGQIVILNGTPRSGKSSIAAVIQDTFDGVWMNLGVDNYMRMIPQRYQPGIGLRPGGERPDLEPLIVRMYEAMYESIAAHSRQGINVVVDVGHHDSYAEPRGILKRCAEILKDYPTLLVGVHCPLSIVMDRRMATWNRGYDEDGSVPKPVMLWQEQVHIPGIYDLEVDTSVLSPQECADTIKSRWKDGPPPTALRRISES